MTPLRAHDDAAARASVLGRKLRRDQGARRVDGFSRLLLLLCYLTVTPAHRSQLAEYFHVTLRTINRWLGALRSCGVPLQRLRGNRWYVPAEWWEQLLERAYERRLAGSGLAGPGRPTRTGPDK